MFKLGEFNYSYLWSYLSSQTSLDWVSFLESLFYNGLLVGDLHESPTFRRDNTIYSTIDYIFVGNALRNQVQESNIHKLDPAWADHSMFSIKLTIGTAVTGHELWGANPIFLRNPQYQHYLQKQLYNIVLDVPSVCNPQTTWDRIKTKVKTITRNFAIKYTDWWKTTIRQLQGDRNRFLRSKPPRDIKIPRLTDRLIAKRANWNISFEIQCTLVWRRWNFHQVS